MTTNTTPWTTSKTVRGAGIALALGLALGVGGCSAGGSDSGAGSSASGDSVASSALDSANFSGAAASKAAARGVKVDSVAVTDASAQQQIRTAQVTLRVAGIDDAAARVRAIATGLGGLVQDENSTFGTGSKAGSRAKGGSVITLRVPADQLDTAIGQLGDVGRRLDLHTSSKDVTTTVADLDSRVESQQKSVDRMRALLAEARSVKDIIAIESQLSSREADLESLQAQALAVKDKVALSTLVVTLKPTPAAAAVKDDDDNGFLAGLSTGWDFVKKTGVVTLTVVGTLLPLGVVLTVIAVPAWFLYRRFGVPGLKPAANPPAPSAPGGTPSP